MRPTPALLALALSACAATPADPEAALLARAAALHADAIVIETHSDTTPKFETGWDFSARHEGGHMDIPRIREGGLDAVFFSIWMGRTPGDGTAVKRATRRMDAVYEAARRWPADLAIATSADDVRAAAAEGRVACLMGIEGGHMIENDLANLRTLYRLGARYMTLTHSFHLDWADSAGTDHPLQPQSGGLTDFGREVVGEMNRLGMMVDVSHVSDDTFWDVIEVSEAPVIATHSSCRAVANHPRNMSDEMIRAVAENGGVVQINFYPGYADPAWADLYWELADEVAAAYAEDPANGRARRIELYDERAPGPTSWTLVVDHIAHVIDLVGAEYVGLGADWDGVPFLPQGMEDCSKLERLTVELLRRGYSEEQVRMVLGDNVLRVMEACERHAAGVAP